MSGRILLAAGAVLAALLGAWRLLAYVEQAGYDRGHAAAQDACRQADLASLQAVIASTRGLAEAAHAASQKLGQTISARQQADAKTTREIRDALAATAGSRAGCVFDTGVMQHLAAARDRAAAAAASGLRGAVPGTD